MSSQVDPEYQKRLNRRMKELKKLTEKESLLENGGRKNGKRNRKIKW